MLAKVVMLAILTLSFLIDRSSAATFKLENFVSKNVTFVVNSLGNSSLAQNIAAWNTNNNQNQAATSNINKTNISILYSGSNTLSTTLQISTISTKGSTVPSSSLATTITVQSSTVPAENSLAKASTPQQQPQRVLASSPLPPLPTPLPNSPPNNSNVVSLTALLSDPATKQNISNSAILKPNANSGIAPIQASQSGPSPSPPPLPSKISSQIMLPKNQPLLVNRTIQLLPPLNLLPAYMLRENVPTIQILNEQPNSTVSGVILSIFNGHSYDQLFTSVQQRSKDGTYVIVYSSTADLVKAIRSAFSGDFTQANGTNKQVIQQLVQDVLSIGDKCPTCITVNWECSSGYANQKFTEGKNQVLSFAKFLIDKGYTVMFSDFSLKALINEWDQALFGRNPFIKLGETYNPIELYFDPQTLQICPSTQLQILGQLAQSGTTQVSVEGGTIIYSVVAQSAANQPYNLQVLTIATNIYFNYAKYPLSLAGKTGTAGHVLLTYKSGGHLLASMGHWIQLMTINTSAQKLFSTYAKVLGSNAATELQNQYKGLSPIQQSFFVQENAKYLVQSQSPGQNQAYNAN